MFDRLVVGVEEVEPAPDVCLEGSQLLPLRGECFTLGLDGLTLGGQLGVLVVEVLRHDAQFLGPAGECLPICSDLLPLRCEQQELAVDVFAFVLQPGQHAFRPFERFLLSGDLVGAFVELSLGPFDGTLALAELVFLLGQLTDPRVDALRGVADLIVELVQLRHVLRLLLATAFDFLVLPVEFRRPFTEGVLALLDPGLLQPKLVGADLELAGPLFELAGERIDLGASVFEEVAARIERCFHPADVTLFGIEFAPTPTKLDSFQLEVGSLPIEVGQTGANVQLVGGERRPLGVEHCPGSFELGGKCLELQTLGVELRGAVFVVRLGRNQHAGLFVELLAPCVQRRRPLFELLELDAVAVQFFALFLERGGPVGEGEFERIELRLLAFQLGRLRRNGLDGDPSFVDRGFQPIDLVGLSGEHRTLSFDVVAFDLEVGPGAFELIGFGPKAEPLPFELICQLVQAGLFGREFFGPGRDLRLELGQLGLGLFGCGFSEQEVAGVLLSPLEFEPCPILGQLPQFVFELAAAFADPVGFGFEGGPLGEDLRSLFGEGVLVGAELALLVHEAGAFVVDLTGELAESLLLFDRVGGELGEAILFEFQRRASGFELGGFGVDALTDFAEALGAGSQLLVAAGDKRLLRSDFGVQLFEFGGAPAKIVELTLEFLLVVLEARATERELVELLLEEFAGFDNGLFLLGEFFSQRRDAALLGRELSDAGVELGGAAGGVGGVHAFGEGDLVGGELAAALLEFDGVSAQAVAFRFDLGALAVHRSFFAGGLVANVDQGADSVAQFVLLVVEVGPDGAQLDFFDVEAGPECVEVLFAAPEVGGLCVEAGSESRVVLPRWGSRKGAAGGEARAGRMIAAAARVLGPAIAGCVVVRRVPTIAPHVTVLWRVVVAHSCSDPMEFIHLFTRVEKIPPTSKSGKRSTPTIK